MSPAWAHDSVQGPNGGRVVEAGAYHIELVAKGPALEAFLTDADEKPLSPGKFRGVAVLLVDGKVQRIPLVPEGGGLAGRAQGSLPAAPKGAVQITAPDGQAISARFD
ncbi:hypothetical protein [Chelatococcus reniformis]|uniref:Uncharacterized protein n=1 Tax=Chelatococcus reniformis TaxID=1494448 RepID=A0A916XB49_9HYPH|nr:hypothetical protein [Chelatococcus reniformis]GGC58706.1 hypothetical protein GCM10010994_16980 [Chelatococcus reniformis]